MKTKTEPPSDLIPNNNLKPTPKVEEIDPLLARINEFWETFMDAPYEEQWTLATNMLAEEPELCDDEMVFEITNELFGQAVNANETDRYKEMLCQLEKIVPESYAKELQYILDWQIQIALMEGDDASVEHYFHQFSPLAGEHFDLYYLIMSRLAYHGKLEILYTGMRQALPFIADDDNLIDWGYHEFIEKLGNIEILHLLNQDNHLNEGVSTLQQRFAEYELTIESEFLLLLLEYRTGRKTPNWTRDDFKFSDKQENNTAKKNLNLLFVAFTHFAHTQEGVSLTKAEMVYDELSSYLSQRHAGKLGAERGNKHRRHHKRKKQKKVYYLLLPDSKTLDKYIAELMGFMSFRHYEAFALFELLPTWLRFLTKYGLLDEKEQLQTVQEMGYLKKALIQFASKTAYDPTLKQNMVDWPYNAASEGTDERGG